MAVVKQVRKLQSLETLSLPRYILRLSPIFNRPLTVGKAGMDGMNSVASFVSRTRESRN